MKFFALRYATIYQLHVYLILAKNPDAKLFLTPMKGVDEEDEIWYYANRPMGASTLGQFMKRISADAELSKVYTNQCVGRATSITTLNKSGFSKDTIMLLTRHHNTEGK